MFYSYLPTFLFLLKFSSSSRVPRSCLLAPKLSSPATTTLPAISAVPSIRLPEIFFFVLPFIRAPLPFFSRSPRPAPLRARSLSLSHLPPSRSISPGDGWATAPLLLFLRAVLPFLLPFPRRALSLCLSGDGRTTAPLPRPPYDRCLVSIAAPCLLRALHWRRALPAVHVCNDVLYWVRRRPSGFL